MDACALACTTIGVPRARVFIFGVKEVRKGRNEEGSKLSFRTRPHSGAHVAGLARLVRPLVEVRRRVGGDGGNGTEPYSNHFTPPS